MIAGATVMLALDPNDVITLVNLATMYIHLDQHVEAVKTAERAFTLDPEFAFAQGTLAYVYGRVGRRAEARKILARLEQRPDVSPYILAAVQVGLHDHDRAFQQLDRAVEGTDDQISDLGMDAVFDPLRSDPRMEALLDRLKLKGYASSARSVAGE